VPVRLALLGNALNRAAAAVALAVIGVAAVGMLGVWIEYPARSSAAAPGIILLMLFAGLKLLETRTHRDAAPRRVPRLLPSSSSPISSIPSPSRPPP